ncbi:hypothetical protein TEA_018696 [Camellia sinensis var. sinensis]|uniref:TCP domain-containing protein n=1 Tax=Camellia sinensis var. sinensis TaxID=542762 RepID=A0A4S4DLQ8_CAMSN|nr:hypothetical protein TEA_018696 [Camellia sinensis var. sinensis]
MFCNIFDSSPKQSPLSLLCSTHSKHYLHTSLSLSPTSQVSNSVLRDLSLPLPPLHCRVVSTVAPLPISSPTSQVSNSLSSEISLFLSLLSTVESSPPSCRFRSPLQLLRSQTLCPQRSLSSSPSSPPSSRLHRRAASDLLSNFSGLKLSVLRDLSLPLPPLHRRVVSTVVPLPISSPTSQVSNSLSSEISLFLSLLSTVESSPPSCRFRSPLQLLRSQTLCPQRSLSSSPSSPPSSRLHRRAASDLLSNFSVSKQESSLPLKKLKSNINNHSKVCTAKGPRDRRVRLSAHTAIQFYDVQDRLGYGRPSQAIDWLMKEAKTAIDALHHELPSTDQKTEKNQHFNEEEDPINGFCLSLPHTLFSDSLDFESTSTNWYNPQSQRVITVMGFRGFGFAADSGRGGGAESSSKQGILCFCYMSSALLRTSKASRRIKLC